MAGRIIKILALVVLILGVIAVAAVGPIDRSPLPERKFYQDMMANLAAAQPQVFDGDSLFTGWSKVNITPDESMPMAGYYPRDGFDAVHDSLYARILRVGNGSANVAFVNVDLLLFPTQLKSRIQDKLDSLNCADFLYLSATHTHHSVGAWDNSIGGRLAFGSFNEGWLERTANAIAKRIRSVQLSPSALSYWEADARDLVENRLDRDHGVTDGIIRGLQVTRADSTRAILFTFSAHPTSLERDTRILSADYPAAMISQLEQHYDFGMFMAGMVGSHRFAWTPLGGFEFIEYIAPEMVERMDSVTVQVKMQPTIKILRQEILFGKAQPRISKNWKIRDWVARLLTRELRGEATYVEIGNTIFVGLPCDFSGEIFQREKLGEFANAHGKNIIITSFNGEYIGYITWDEYYETATAEEVNATNWVGPGYGKYFTEILRHLIALDSPQTDNKLVQ